MIVTKKLTNAYIEKKKQFDNTVKTKYPILCIIKKARTKRQRITFDHV